MAVPSATAPAAGYRRQRGRTVSSFVLRRTRDVLVQVAVVTTVVFFLVRLLPGDPSYYLAGSNATPERLATIRHNLALDRSLPVQFWAYVRNLVEGDWGQSFSTSGNV